MVLGKRTRSSLASSSSSSIATVSSSSKSSLSTPASSAAGSPAPPSLKRLKTRPSVTIVDEDGFNNKENVAPDNWFVCGRSASLDVNAESDDEDDEQDPPARRLTRSRARTSNLNVNTRTTTAPSRLTRTRSAPTNTLDTPPPTPVTLTRTATTPALHLAELTIDATDDSMDDVQPTPPASPTKPKSVYSRARTLLRCNATTASASDDSSPVIAARETERAAIQEYILAGDFLSRNASKSDEAPISSLYISGQPGTGKTALVTDILNQLRLRGDVLPSVAVYVNCTGLADTKAIWSQVWEELVQNLGGSVGKKLKSGEPKKYLEDALKRDQGLRCILVLDELDFISRNPSALSEIYQLSHKYPTTLRFIGISNTLTLGAESSRSGPSTPTKISRSASSSTVVAYAGPQKSINFPAYSPSDLLTIINARLSRLDAQELADTFNPAALNFLSKKVASTNGDVRFALSVLRRCVDSVEREANELSPSDAKGKKGRVDMKHVLESLRAHESGAANGKEDANKGSGTSRTVRSLGLHARLVLLALLLGWKRLEAGLPLSLQPVASSSKAPATEDKMTSNALYSFYVALLTATVVNDQGEGSSSTPFNPISRGEFQDVFGVLETSGIVTSTLNAPIFNAGRVSASSSTPNLATSLLSPPKTPRKPRMNARSASMNSLTFSGSASGSSRKKAHDLCIVLNEGIREDEVVRGLVSATVASAATQGIMEREVEALWERETKRITKEVQRLERKRVEANEKERLQAIAFED